MTDAEIIKALECHAKENLDTCALCPLLNVVGCGCKSAEYALGLINRQKAEIERLKLGVNVELDNFASEYDSKIKAEAIKEFAEKLKDDMVPNIDDTYIESFVEEYIDDLVKEMAGDAE